jgi:hypothetical protein
MDELTGVNSSDTSREINESPTAAELRAVLFRLEHLMRQPESSIDLTLEYIEQFQPTDLCRVSRDAEFKVRLIRGTPQDFDVRAVIPLTIEGYPDGSSKLIIGHGGGSSTLGITPREYRQLFARLHRTAREIAPDMEIQQSVAPIPHDRYPHESRVRAMLDRVMAGSADNARGHTR